MAVLKVENISKSFGKTPVLNDISFTMEKGEILAIIGSSGSGKTTLLRCLNFLETPDTGKISVNDELLLDCAQNTGKSARVKENEIRLKRLHFGLVFQSFNLFPQYTVKKNLMLAHELLALEKLKENGDYMGLKSKSEIREFVSENAEKLLDRVGLLHKKDAYPHQLSGGQQQRVAIARALSLSPDILCFDEPTSALDPELTGEVLNVIRGLKSSDSTMIVVTHEMKFAKEVADKVIFMDGGYIVEYGDAKEVIENPKEERTKAFLSGIQD